MPITFCVDAHGVICNHYAGVITRADILAFFDARETAHRALGAGPVREFDDLRALEQFTVEPDELARLLDFSVSLYRRNRVQLTDAMLAPDGVGRRLAEGFADYTRDLPDFHVRRCDTLAEAASFLGLPDNWAPPPPAGAG